jgi:putative flippase GtrA
MNLIRIINKNFLKLISFSIIGIINTFIDIAILNLLIYVFNIENHIYFLICKGVSFLFAVTNSYFMNNYFTFSQKKVEKKDFINFLILSIFGLLVNTFVSGFIFNVLISYKDIYSVYLIGTFSAIIGSGITMLVNYFNYSYFIFNKK